MNEPKRTLYLVEYIETSQDLETETHVHKPDITPALYKRGMAFLVDIAFISFLKSYAVMKTKKKHAGSLKFVIGVPFTCRKYLYDLELT